MAKDPDTTREAWQRSEDLPETSDVHRLHSPILRERREPRDGYEPVPLWLVAIFGVLTFWAGWYLSEYSGGWDSSILDPRPEARYAGAAADRGPVDPVELGRKLYTAHCVSCHQQGGQGVPGQYPPLAGSEWVLTHPQRLKRILLLGLQGEVRVRGQVYDGNMPAFGARLKDEHIAAVLTYVRRSWGNDAGPIGPESVQATRKAIEGRTAPWTMAELQAITAPDFTPPPPGEGQEGE